MDILSKSIPLQWAVDITMGSSSDCLLGPGFLHMHVSNVDNIDLNPPTENFQQRQEYIR